MLYTIIAVGLRCTDRIVEFTQSEQVFNLYFITWSECISIYVSCFIAIRRLLILDVNHSKALLLLINCHRTRLGVCCLSGSYRYVTRVDILGHNIFSYAADTGTGQFGQFVNITLLMVLTSRGCIYILNYFIAFMSMLAFVYHFYKEVS